MIAKTLPWRTGLSSAGALLCLFQLNAISSLDSMQSNNADQLGGFLDLNAAGHLGLACAGAVVCIAGVILALKRRRKPVYDPPTAEENDLLFERVALELQTHFGHSKNESKRIADEFRSAANAITSNGRRFLEPDDLHHEGQYSLAEYAHYIVGLKNPWDHIAFVKWRTVRNKQQEAAWEEELARRKNT